MLPGQIIEDNYTVRAFKQYLPAVGERNVALVQFWAVKGGLRTVPVNHIEKITGNRGGTIK